MSESIIRAQGLGLQVGSRFLLRQINWEVHAGEHWLVFGQNGSGKTTLLSMVAGFKNPTDGRLTVLGEAYSNDNVFALRRQVGWVSSSFFDRFYRYEPALEIVLSGLSGTFGIRSGLRDVDVRRAKTLLAALRLGDKINRPYHMMSKGERQNVLIARALISEPSLLVLDEPSEGLDIYAREYLLQTIRAFAETEKMTILYVTHYPEEIQGFMKKTLLMRHGQIFAQGDTADVLTSDNLSRLMNAPVDVRWLADGGVRMHVAADTELVRICYGAKEDGADGRRK